MKQVSVILQPITQRKKNLPEIISAIRKQYIPVDIWIWDISGEFKNQGEDVYIYCNQDFCTKPRYFLTGLIQTPYCMMHDDDFVITDLELFMKMIDLDKKYSGKFFSLKGKKFDESAKKELKPYQCSNYWVVDGEADVVCSGITFFQTQIMTKLPINPVLYPHRSIEDSDWRNGSCIWISSWLNCYVSKTLRDGVKELDECGFGVSHEPRHMEVRNRLCRKYFLE